MHWCLADVIATWHHQQLRKELKAAGIKFRPKPQPPRLGKLPCRLMVLSWVMLTMHSVAMAAPISLAPPVTWVQAIGGPRNLLGAHPFVPLPRKPPDPWSFVSPALDGEGNVSELEADSVVNQEPAHKTEGTSCQHGCGCSASKKSEGDHRHKRDMFPEFMDGVCCQECSSLADEQSNGTLPTEEETLTCGSLLTEEDMDDFSAFSFVTGISAVAARAMDEWNDLPTHVCMLAEGESFGPLAMLSAEDDLRAIVDTGASLTVTPFREDFVEWTPTTGKVIKGLTAGAEVAGVGIVSWNIEVGGTTVELKLRALHVPSAQCRLLCPQQLVKEHKPKVATNPTIGEEAITIEFAEGVVECFYNQSNLPMVRLSSTADLKANFATLRAMILEDNNQNLTAAQKELLR